MSDKLKGKSAIDDFYMPPLKAENLDDSGVELLREAVVVKLCDDIVSDIRYELSRGCMLSPDHGSLESSLSYYKRYLKSEYFKMWTTESIDGEALLNWLKYKTPEKCLTEKEKELGGLYVKELEKYYLYEYRQDIQKIIFLDKVILLTAQGKFKRRYKIILKKNFKGMSNKKIFRALLKEIKKMKKEVEK